MAARLSRLPGWWAGVSLASRPLPVTLMPPAAFRLPQRPAPPPSPIAGVAPADVAHDAVTLMS